MSRTFYDATFEIAYSGSLECPVDRMNLFTFGFNYSCWKKVPL